MSDFLEKQLEKLIVDALQTVVDAAVAGLQYPEKTPVSCLVTGMFQPSEAGTVKAPESTGVLVKMSIAANQNYTSPLVTLSCLIEIKTSVSDDPRCNLLPLLTGPVVNLLREWNRSPADMSAALTVTGVFKANGLMSTGGAEPMYDPNFAVWYLPLQLQIKGVIETPEVTPEP